MASGLHGSLNARGYRLVSGPEETPRFEPGSTTADEGWGEEFTAAGVDADVHALMVDAGGKVYAGGWFDKAGGVSARSIAKWNGCCREGLGSGVKGDVRALALDGCGNVYAGGRFTMAGGKPSPHMARWTEKSLPSRPLSGTVRLGGVGLSGVTVTLREVTTGSGAGATRNATTDTGGHYCFPGLSDGICRITPAMTGYAFTPARGRVKLAGTKVARRNFTASLSGCFATGKVTHVASGLGGVTINLTCTETRTTTTRSVGS